MHVSRLPIVLCCLAAIACGRSSPAPPVVTPPSGNETINGTERIGWDQRAADTVELAAIGYVLYVDGTRTPLTAVTCATSCHRRGVCLQRAAARLVRRSSHAAAGLVHHRRHGARKRALGGAERHRRAANERGGDAAHHGEAAVATGLERRPRRNRRPRDAARRARRGWPRRTDRSRVCAGRPAARRRTRRHDPHPSSCTGSCGTRRCERRSRAGSCALAGGRCRRRRDSAPGARARPAVRAHAVRVRDLHGAVAIGRADVHAGSFP